MDRATQRLVRQRAGDECEYCGLSQVDVPLYVFQFDHVIPRQHGGTDDVSNLALACPQCNSHKGTNLAAIDPDSGQVVAFSTPGKTDGMITLPVKVPGSSVLPPKVGRPLGSC